MNRKILKMVCAITLMTAIALGTSGMKSLSVSAANGEPGRNGYFLIDEDGKEYWVEGDFEDAVNTEESVSLNSEADSKIKLQTPTGVTWDGWKCKWNPVPEAKGHYDFELYKDGKKYKSRGLGAGELDDGYDLFSREISESGVYKYRMIADNDHDPDTYEESEWSEFSEEKVYNRPSRSLGTTVGWWDETTPGLFHWNPVEDAGYYSTDLYHFNEEKGEYEHVIGYIYNYDTFDSFSDDIAQEGAGKYIVKVQACSDDIDTIATGEWGEASEVLDTSVNAAAISDAISESLKNSGNNAERALNELKGKATPAQLASAMQTDSNVLNQMKELERLYAEQKRVSISDVAVSQDAKKYIDSSKVSTVGSGLSAAANSSIGLKVDMKQNKIDVPSNRYAKSVQLDIVLENNGTKVHDLVVPVTVTMPVPKGIPLDKLTIIHYSEDGTYRTVSFKDNGDGTISFTVTHFSTFVFASRADGESDDTEAQIRAFVSRMYTVALGREAEQKGLDDWSEQLINHTNDGAGLARGFICSAEFTNKNLSNDAYVNTLYKTFFDREPDEGGKANWLSALNGGTSRNEVLAGFVNSLEFANLCDKYGIARGTLESDGSSIYNAGVRNFVLRMYTKCLKRDGETVGVEDWSHRINTKEMDPEGVAKSFFSSEEFLKKNLSNEDYVETLYETFMDRASDEGGKADWVNKLNSGVSRQTVLEGFSRSPEFAKIMAEFGL